MSALSGAVFSLRIVGFDEAQLKHTGNFLTLLGRLLEAQSCSRLPGKTMVNDAIFEQVR